jgi:hypothetical protein
MKNLKFLAAAVFVSALTTTVLESAAPAGWFMAGSKPALYESGVDATTVLNGLPSAYMKSIQPVPDGFGTLMQNFIAKDYVGKRVRFSANVKSENIERWAGLWMRVDDNSKDARQPKMLAFDNMMDRPIKGTTGWQSYDIVLDVPEGATGIFFGILMDGAGEVWMNGVKFEVVGDSVATTAKPAIPPPATPTNLNFEK